MPNVGSDLAALASLSGAIVDQNGQTLLSTDTFGSQSQLAGRSLLREIRAGVANGDFSAVPPDTEANIGDENQLPYWEWTPDSSSTPYITCKIVGDPADPEGNVLRFTVAANAPIGRSATLKRYIPIDGSRGRNLAAGLNAYVAGGSAINPYCNITLSFAWAKLDFTATGTGASSTTNTFSTSAYELKAPQNGSYLYCHAPSDAAYMLVTITIATSLGVTPSSAYIDLSEVRMFSGGSTILLANTSNPATSAPALIQNSDGNLIIRAVMDSANNTGVNIDDGSYEIGLVGDLVTDDNIGTAGFIYFARDFTGPYIRKSGTNSRTIAALNADANSGVDWVASTSSTRSGIMVTKSCTGQPTTNLNGTGATDAFADVLRNGGLALDVTNNRGYWYSGGWKYTALTTPSDSRLKKEITEISGALDKLRQLMPVAFKWKAPEAHGRTDCVADDGTRMGFVADQVATTDLAHWVETLGVDEREAHLVDTPEVLAVNIPQNEIEALLVQALLDIDARLTALESR